MVDLSNVLWLATANTLDGVPGPLRDRCRILVFPQPGAEHLEALAPVLMRKAAERMGLDPRWVAPLDGQEMELLRAFWRGGSVRRLARFIDAILDARGRGQEVH